MSPIRALARLLLLLVIAAVVVTCGGGPDEVPADGGPNLDGGASGEATAFVFNFLPTTLQAGAPESFTLRAVDGAGNTATGYRGTVHFTASHPSTKLPADHAFDAADLGVHAFPFTVLQAGVETLHAVDAVDAALSGESAVTCAPGPASAYVISNLGAAQQAKVPATFDVTAVDAYLNVATGYVGTAVVTSGDPAAVLPPNPKLAAGVATGVSLTFMTPGVQTVTVTDALLPALTVTAQTTVASAPTADVTAPGFATVGSAGHAATVTAQAGATYAWSITNGAVTSGAGTSAITFSVGSVGTSTLTCIVSRGGASTTGSAMVTVVAAPSTPVITGATTVTAASTGNMASVTAHAGMAYAWAITGGAITSAGGGAGVTVGLTNSITYTAGAVGTLVITCIEVNEASDASAPATLSVASVAAPVPPVITAPDYATVGLSLSASAPVVQGLVYTWKVDGAAVASVVANGVTTLTITPAALGPTTLECAGFNGATWSTSTKTVTVVAAPVTPVISAVSPVNAGQTGRTASVVAHSGMTYLWAISGGSITSAGGTAGVTSGSVNTITYTAGPMGTLGLTVVEINAAATSSAPANATVTVVAGPVVVPTITAQSPVTAGVAGLTASVTARLGMTYAWTLSGGTITSAGGSSGVTSGNTNTLTYTAGPPGSLLLGCAESNGVDTSAPAARTVTIVAAPVTPVISVAGSVYSNTAGLTATVVAHAGMTYAWSITNGAITSSSGGVTSNGVNTVTFTSGVAGTLTLAVTETNAASATSAPGTAQVAVTLAPEPPLTPTITLAAAAVTSGASSSASVGARQGMTYTWTINGGVITSAGGASGVTSGSTNTLTFAAGAAGTLTLTCTETNAQNQTSAPATASVNVLAAPQTPVISAPSTVTPNQPGVNASVTAHAGMTYVWSISGGAITSAGGPSGVTSGSTNTLTFTAGASGFVSLSCVEVNALLAASAPGSATITISGGSPSGGHLYVFAHQDDDLLFGNPDIEASIRSGRPTRVVFAMAAGWPTPLEWQAREHGVYEPYLMMANASYNANIDPATYYTCGNHTYDGFPVRQCTLTQNPKVSLVFLRMPDGELASLWATSSGAPFYVTPAATLTSADGVNTYSRSSFIATLAAILADFAPARVGTHDSTFAYGFDHDDHVSSALFALEATHAWGTSADLRLYRGYSTDGAPDYYTIPVAEAVNLSPAEYDRKHAVMEAYGGPFPNGGTFDNWCHRSYAISRVVSGVGPIAASGGCLDTQGGSTADGTRAVAAACSGQASQRWTVRADYQIAGPGGKCLTVVAGNAVQIFPCAATAAQKWTVFANGQVRGQDALCLGVSGGLVGTALCAADTSANAWQPAASQKFTQRASALFAWSAGTDFSDADVGGASSVYRSLQIVELGGDGYADACIRRAAGVYCGVNGHSLLGSYTLFGPAFSDANGWSGDAYGSTVQYADVSGDHVADACARTTTGIVCALGNGATFAAPTSWSAEFSDSTVFAGPLYYRSLHFADVNGDGYADVCGRTATGVTCALNARNGSFAASTAWITGQFTDAGGWNADAYASTVQLADVNGDGRADVCGRGPSGIVCAVSNGVNAFANDHLWSFRTDFADAAGWSAAAGYYGSVHLGDVNGDGLADVCGRNASGLACALSDGVAFQQSMPLQPGAFTNAQGWLPDAYGTSLRLADVDHDGRADACGRSSAGLVCTTSP